MQQTKENNKNTTQTLQTSNMKQRAKHTQQKQAINKPINQSISHTTTTNKQRGKSCTSNKHIIQTKTKRLKPAAKHQLRI
jgi:hypothetical protein